jgi:ribosomal protein S18 acetylase RimI-like enzyme
MQIRTFRPADLPVLVDLAIEVFGPFYEQSYRTMVPPVVYEHQHGRWADDYRDSVPKLHDPDDGKHVAVAVSDTSRVEGFVAWHVDQERRLGQIEMLAVREPARGAGLGRALCEHALSAIGDRDVDVVSLGTGGDWFHAPARALYESLGFSAVPVVYYLRPA